jgi:hypothetical protein
MPLPIEDVSEVLRQHSITGDSLTKIVRDLVRAEQELKDSRAAGKPSKKAKSRFTVLVRADGEEAASQLRTLTAGGVFVLTAPEPDEENPSPADSTPILDRIKAAVRVFNDSLKRKRGDRTIRTFVQAMAQLKAGAFKKAEMGKVNIKTREAVEVVVVSEEAI